MSWDKFALGLAGAWQQSQQNDIRQQEMDRANKLLEMQLSNSAADRARYDREYGLKQEELGLKREDMARKNTIEDRQGRYYEALTDKVKALTVKAGRGGVPKQGITLQGMEALMPGSTGNSFDRPQQGGVSTPTPGVPTSMPAEMSEDGTVPYTSDSVNLSDAGALIQQPVAYETAGLPVNAASAPYTAEISAAPTGSMSDAPGGYGRPSAPPAIPITTNPLRVQETARVLNGENPTDVVSSIDEQKQQIADAAPQRAEAQIMAGAARELETTAEKFRQAKARIPSVTKDPAVQKQYARELETQFQHEAKVINTRYSDIAKTKAGELANRKVEMKASRDDAKDSSGDYARLDDLAKRVSTEEKHIPDQYDPNKSTKEVVVDTGMYTRLADNMRVLYDNNPQALKEGVWQKNANEMKKAYNAKLVALKVENNRLDPSQRTSVEDLADQAKDFAYSVVESKLRPSNVPMNKSPAKDFGPAAPVDFTGGPRAGALQSVGADGPDPNKTEYERSNGVEAVRAPVPSQVTAGLPVPKIEVPENMSPAKVAKYLSPENQAEDDRVRRVKAQDDALLGYIGGIPMNAAKKAAELADVAVGRPARAVVDMAKSAIDSKWGNTGLKNELDSAAAAYAEASPTVRHYMDIQAKKKWGFTVGDILKERSNPKYKEND